MAYSINKQWIKKYEELKKFYDDKGHLKVKNNKELQKWISRERQKYKKCPSSYNQEKLDKLKLIGFNFDYIQKKNKWDEKFAELREYKEKNGNTNEVELSSSLGIWCSNTRCALNMYKNEKKKEINLEFERRIELLDGIDFEWNKYRKWDDMYEKYVSYLNNDKSDAMDIELQRWCEDQRREMKRYLNSQGKKIAAKEDCIKKLNEVGFEWNPRDKNFRNCIKRKKLSSENSVYGAAVLMNCRNKEVRIKRDKTNAIYEVMETFVQNEKIMCKLRYKEDHSYTVIIPYEDIETVDSCGYKKKDGIRRSMRKVKKTNLYINESMKEPKKIKIWKHIEDWKNKCKKTKDQNELDEINTKFIGKMTNNNWENEVIFEDNNMYTISNSSLDVFYMLTRYVLAQKYIANMTFITNTKKK